MAKRRHHEEWTIALLFLGTCIPALAQSEFKNLRVLPPDIEEQELRGLMNSWSNALGFRCDSCHWSPTRKFDDLEFEVDKKETKQTLSTRSGPRQGRR